MRKWIGKPRRMRSDCGEWIAAETGCQATGIAFGWCFWRVAELGDVSECEREFIAAAVGRSRQFVDQWDLGRYRMEGLAGLYPEKQPGAPCKLSVSQQQELVTWLERGPTPEEKLAAYNGPILREKIQERFGKLYLLNGVYALLHRLGYNDLMPRPKHPETDPALLEEFKKKSSRKPSKRSRQAHPGQRLLTFYQDEARFGQHGTITRVWAKVGTRPRAIRQTQYDYLYVFAAVCPGETGIGLGADCSGDQYHDDECVPGGIRQRTAGQCARGDGAGPGRLACRQGVKSSSQRHAAAPCRPNRRNSIPRKICGTTCAATITVQPALQDLGRSQRRGH